MVKVMATSLLVTLLFGMGLGYGARALTDKHTGTDTSTSGAYKLGQQYSEDCRMSVATFLDRKMITLNDVDEFLEGCNGR